MFMKMHYLPAYPGAMPVELRMKLQDQDGPRYAKITWDPCQMTKTCLDNGFIELTGEVLLDGAHGMAPYAMYSAKLLGLETKPETELAVQLLEFGGSARTTDCFTVISANGNSVPTFRSENDPESGITGYFRSQSLFCREPVYLGGMYAVLFDGDVSIERIVDFMQDHPAGLGCFSILLDQSPDGDGVIQRPCYLFAARDHAEMDVSVWRSRDRHDRQDK